MKVSICFLGTGSINEKHVRLLRNFFPRIQISVASRDLSRAKAFKERYHLDDCFGSYESAIESAFSVIVIGLPPKYHFDLVSKILACGKHMLIEKPIFNSLHEFNKLWPSLKQYSGFVMVLENQFFDPFHKRIKNLLEKHDFGKPLFLELTRLGHNKLEGWRNDPSEMLLGAFHEGGVHWIRKLLDIAAIYESDPYHGILGVTAYCPQISLTNTPGEDTMMVMARHRSGLVSRLFHSWGIPKRTGFMDLSKILMEKGAIYFNSRGIIGICFGRKTRILWPSFRDSSGYKAMWKHLIECIENDKSPALTLEDIYFDFLFMDAAYRSIKTQREVLLGEIPTNHHA